MRRLTVVITLVLLIFTSCGKKAEEDAKKVSDRMVPDDEKLLLAASEILVDSFGKQLKAELISALTEGGLESAISVCQVRAPQIATANSGEFWTIKRVSDRNRNPGNLADNHELSVMMSFDTANTSGPVHSYQWIDTAGARTFCYYRPIRVMPLCTKCHGTDTDIDDATKAALAELYPDDKATGYKPGDLRGMFVVEVKWPEGRPFADSLVRAAP